MAAYYHRHGIRTIAYRPGMFVPESFLGYGFRLLKGGVEYRDVASTFLLGLDGAGIAFDAFNVMAEVPFSTEEFGELVRMWGFTYWSIEKTKRVLGYRPRYNFPEFFEALRRGDRSHYPYADLLWWGV